MKIASGKRIRSIASVLFLAILCGCQAAGYYYQAIRGQLEILSARRPIDKVISDPRSSADLREKLEQVQRIRAFAQSELSLPVGGSYADYVDLKRPQALWSIFATPEFSLNPKKWCYPVAGCTPYRGYFQVGDAKRYARQLKQQALDVYIAAVPAYSTLGWFDDPVFNTFIHQDDLLLAAMIFHELAHRRLYVPGDAVFNESFAVVVESEGVRRWLVKGGGSGDYAAYERRQEGRRLFLALIAEVRRRLQALYQRTNLSVESMRAEKSVAYEWLKREYRRRAIGHPELATYRYWFEGPLNNAHLAAVGTYHDLEPQLKRLLDQVGGNMEVFYRRCDVLVNLSTAQRLRILNFEGQAADLAADDKPSQTSQPVGTNRQSAP